MILRLKMPLSRKHPASTGLPFPSWQLKISELQLSLRTLIDCAGILPKTDDPFSPPLVDGRTLRYQNNTRGLVAHPGTQTWPAWIAELARFVVPKGMFGMIKSFDQFLAFTDDAYGVPTSSPQWGIPFTGFGSGQSAFGANRWHFRLFEFYGTEPAWINAQNTVAIPGFPHPDLPFVDDLWFPVHSPSSTNFHLPVPNGHILRVFLELGAQSDQPFAAARLSGWTSTYLSDECRHAIRSSW